MNILKEIENFINEFNRNNDENFAIDTIRIEFQKRYKLEELKEVGIWHKINSKDRKILSKLKKRLTEKEITTAYQLENESIYFYNSTAINYNIATLVIFGMKQYHKEPPRRELISKLVNILTRGTSKLSINIDICLDINTVPNIERIKRYFDVKQYRDKSGKQGDTFYINRPLILMVEKITIYNKALKNGLDGILWRIEAKVTIPNFRDLTMPLQELKKVTDIIKKQTALAIAKQLTRGQ